MGAGGARKPRGHSFHNGLLMKGTGITLLSVIGYTACFSCFFSVVVVVQRQVLNIAFFFVIEAVVQSKFITRHDAAAEALA